MVTERRKAMIKQSEGRCLESVEHEHISNIGVVGAVPKAKPRKKNDLEAERMRKRIPAWV